MVRNRFDAGLGSVIQSLIQHDHCIGLAGRQRLQRRIPLRPIAAAADCSLQLVLVPFSRELAALSPEAFVEQVLVQQLQAQLVAVGENFRFGARRSGDIHLSSRSRLYMFDLTAGADRRPDGLFALGHDVHGCACCAPMLPTSNTVSKYTWGLSRVKALQKNCSHHGYGLTRLDALGTSGFSRCWSLMVAGRAMVKQGQAGRY